MLPKIKSFFTGVLVALSSSEKELQTIKTKYSALLSDYSKVVADNTRKEDEKKKQVAELSVLKEKLARTLPVVDPTTGNPEPMDHDQRVGYVARVAGFHREVLEAKIIHMIAQVREQQDTIHLELPTGYTRAEYDLILRGTSNGLKLLLDWGDIMVGEHLNNSRKEQN